MEISFLIANPCGTRQHERGRPLPTSSASKRRSLFAGQSLIAGQSLGACLSLMAGLHLGCTASEPPEAADSAEPRSAVRDSAGIRIVENFSASWTTPWRVAPEPSLTIGSIGGNPDQELDRVTGGVRLANGSVVVANAGWYELLYYDQNGALVHRAGGRGGGPGEFQSLEWIARFGADSVLALDVHAQRVSFFDSQGRFGRSIRLEPNADMPFPAPVGFFSDGSLLAIKGLLRLGADPPIRAERAEEPLYRFEADGSAATLLGHFPGPERIVVPTGPAARSGGDGLERRARPFGRRTVFAAAADLFFVADNDRYEIRVYASDGQLRMIIRRESDPIRLTGADYGAFRDSVLEAVDTFARAQMRVLFETMPPWHETLPAYAPHIRVDHELNLWVQESTRPGDPISRWSVYAPDGRLRGMLDLPPGLELLDIGEDYILGLRRDALDVEYVVQYELDRG